MKHDPQSEPDPNDPNFDPLADPSEQLAEKPVEQQPGEGPAIPPPEGLQPATPPRTRKPRTPSPHILQEDARTAAEIKKSGVKDFFIDRPDGPFDDTEDVKNFIKEKGLQGRKLRIIAVKYQGTPRTEEVKRSVTRF